MYYKIVNTIQYNTIGKEGVWGVRKDPIIGGAVCPEDIRLNFYGGDSNISPWTTLLCRMWLCAFKRRTWLPLKRRLCVCKRRPCVFWKEGYVCTGKKGRVCWKEERVCALSLPWSPAFPQRTILSARISFPRQIICFFNESNHPPTFLLGPKCC